MRQFEFHAYPTTDSDIPASTPIVTVEQFDETSSAKAHAGRLAKRLNGPVDLAKAGDTSWADRYIATASPSEHHSTGYRLEKFN